MKLIILTILLTFSLSTFARDYVIFSLSQDLSMGYEDEVIRKNFYVNLGKGQGVNKDSVLDVHRIISVQNPYDNKRRVNYKVKIGELKVIHSSDEASIAKVHKLVDSDTIFEIPQFMIGDHVSISVK
ncbi:MAG: hypothetical protein WCY48_05195 [Candidatus Caldatribacteriota bacterium]